MRLYANEVDRAMWNNDKYERQFGALRASVRLTLRGVFSGEVRRNGSYVYGSNSDSLMTVINNINTFMQGRVYATEPVRPQVVCGSNARTSDYVGSTGTLARVADILNAGLKQKDMGVAQEKVAFDWGENKQREVDVCDKSGARSGDAGKEGVVPVVGDAEGEGA